MQDNNKNITPRNHKGQPHGYWKVYWMGANKIWYTRFYVNWIMYGYALTYDEKKYCAR
jgi:hypothetical protein